MIAHLLVPELEAVVKIGDIADQFRVRKSVPEVGPLLKHLFGFLLSQRQVNLSLMLVAHAAKTTRAISKGVERVLLFPFAVLGNIIVNAYYVPTWPIRWFLRGDKRLFIWTPIFHVGEEVGSDFYSKEWNQDLI